MIPRGRFLIDDTFPGADQFLHQIAAWFSKNMPSVSTQYRVKGGGLADDDPKLWAEVKEKGNGVIMAIGHCSTCTPATVGRWKKWHPYRADGPHRVHGSRAHEFRQPRNAARANRLHSAPHLGQGGR